MACTSKAGLPRSPVDLVILRFRSAYCSLCAGGPSRAGCPGPVEVLVSSQYTAARMFPSARSPGAPVCPHWSGWQFGLRSGGRVRLQGAQDLFGCTPGSEPTWREGGRGVFVLGWLCTLPVGVARRPLGSICVRTGGSGGAQPSPAPSGAVYCGLFVSKNYQERERERYRERER